MLPKSPKKLSGYAKACLTALAENDLGKLFSLGGALGLAYYHEYRTTHDVDAWWEENVSHEHKLDAFPDLLASKMVALVERGAPRDFRDIFTLCMAGLSTPTQCWELWRQRQQLSGSDTNAHRARLAVNTHLARISTHRPLEGIDDLQERLTAERLRSWFAKEFLNELMD